MQAKNKFLSKSGEIYGQRLFLNKQINLLNSVMENDSSNLNEEVTTNNISQVNNGNNKDSSSKEWNLEIFTPAKIVEQLDRYIIGQIEAKKKLALAICSRWRRNKVALPMRKEITPKNILIIGPTGSGKTELARRMADKIEAPFLKVEATKFTEIGYVGRDVDSIIRDLLDNAILLIKENKRNALQVKATEYAKRRILDALVGKEDAGNVESRKVFEERLDAGKLEEYEIEIYVKENLNSSIPALDIPGVPGGQIGIMNIGEMIGKVLGGNKKTKKRRVKVKEARQILINEEVEKLFDEEQIIKEAIDSVTNNGIVFLDEIDKIAARTEMRSEINREGVQRDLLPLLEGTIVSTKYGPVRTDHILFIASGAFHFAKPSDLLPELQGRLPIRVELNPLSTKDLVSILKHTEFSLLKQYAALLETEEVSLKFTDDGIECIAEIASSVNKGVEDIGARRLHTVMEKLLDDISFNAPDLRGQEFTINREYVTERLADIAKKVDLSKFVL